MIFVIALVAVGLAWGLAVRSHIPKRVPLLVPVALAVLSYVLWHGEVEQGNRNLVLVIMAIIEVLTLVAIAAGFVYRRHRTP